MRIYICDNNELLCEHIKNMITEIYENKEIEISVFNNANDLLNAVKTVPDFVFLDISIGQDYGIDVALKLNKSAIKTKIIYITSHLEFVTDICKTNYSNILIKPIQKDKLISVLKSSPEENFIIKSASNIYKIKQDEIIFIESKKRRAYIHTQNETISCYSKLSELMSKLNSSFYMCHKSFIVNMNYIYKFENASLQLKNDISIPISRAKQKDFQQIFTDYLGEQL